MTCYIVFKVNAAGDFIFVGQFDKIKQVYKYCWSILEISPNPCQAFKIIYFINAILQCSDYCEFTCFNGKKRINHIHKYFYQVIPIINKLHSHE